MAQLNIFSNIIRGIKESITSWNTKRKEKADLFAKNSNCFVLQYTKDINVVIVHKSEPYRIWIEAETIDIEDKHGATVLDHSLRTTLLSYMKGVM